MLADFLEGANRRIAVKAGPVRDAASSDGELSAAHRDATIQKGLR